MDNDLMARRLRPPSESPRPQNGHSPLPTDAPPWGLVADTADEVPWDRPQTEPWPPTADDEPSAAVWPPTPATVGDDRADQEPLASLDQPAQPTPDTADSWDQPNTATDDVLSQQMWDSGPASSAPVSQDPWATPDVPPWPTPLGAQNDVQHEVESEPAAPAQASVDPQPTAEAYDAPAPWEMPTAEPPAPVEPLQPVEPPPAMREPAAVSQPPTTLQPPAVFEAAVEPSAEVAQPESAAEPDAQVEDDSTDVSVPGGAPWDKPEAFSWDEPGTIDDRPGEMLATYDEMIPRVSQAVAAASVPHTTTDPDDALAPVLQDVSEPSRPLWPAWTTPAEEATTHAATSPVEPVPPVAFGGKVIGPTPPDDLFDREPTPAADPVAAEQPSEPQLQPDVAAMSIVALPPLFSTAPNSPQQPLVVRIELAIVDQSIRIRSADTARRVGPWSDDDVDAEAVTPRHPEFEPRSHLFDDMVDHEPEPVSPVAADETAVPFPAAAGAATPEVSDLHWALPPLDPVNAVEPPTEAPPWSGRPVQPAPLARRAPEPAPPAPAAVSTWADTPGPHPWIVEPVVSDPLAALPAATFAPAPAPTQPAHPPQPAPVFEPAPQVQSAATQPAAVAQPAPVQATTQARPAANADASDLWFLASEAEPDVTDPVVAAQPTQPSTAMTVGLTIGMAVFVIFLVLVFIYFMTSLLR